MWLSPALLLALLIGPTLLVAVPTTAEAQDEGKVYRIGVLSGGSPG